MIKLPLGNNSDSRKSLKILKSYYDDDFICREKKPWLARLKKSQGPFLAVESAKEGADTAYILDAASQIATLGLGFSPLPFMGTGHYHESWTNRCDTPVAQSLRNAYASFLKRMTGWKHLSMILCNSGAEANERALGFCYAQRVSSRANKILAFEGSFHGRTLVSIACTWSKPKREPFQWPEAGTVFCSWPTVKSGKIDFPIPDNWHKTWESSSSQTFSPPDSGGDKILASEIAVLIQVRERLRSGEFFAIILEPMQSEGGDRYSSNRFHLGLMLISRSFRVPVIYDEVQTGFCLGRDFFWHRQFQLRDFQGHDLNPDFIVCSKKSQLGMILSPHKLNLKPWEREEFSMAALARGLIQGITLQQYGEEILAIEEMAKEKLNHLVERYDQFIANGRALGLCFAFDIHSSQENEQAKAWVADFVKNRFDRGLLYYPAGERTLRFRLNLAFSQQDMDFLFEQLDCLCRMVFLSEKVEPPKTVITRKYNGDRDYRQCANLLKKKLSVLEEGSTSTAWEYLKEEALKEWNVELIRFDKNNFAQYRVLIEQLQKDTYEPVRQTAIELFERSAEHTHSICLGLKKEEGLTAIAFTGPPTLFGEERGLKDDPCLNEQNILYAMDTTVQKKWHGLGMGQFLKYAQILIACERGIKLICGKNRDHLAKGMIKLNLSLGSYEREYIQKNYDDENPHQDSFYYHCPVLWEKAPLNLSCRTTSPWEEGDADFMEEQLPSLVNKICLSNFVSERFLKLLKDIAAPLPSSLQHIYSASGQSECVDKIGKSLWYSNKKSHNKMMTFANNFFGNGTFLARSLHSEGDKFFPVDILPQPTNDNYRDVLAKIEGQLSQESYAGVWIEPVTQRGMQFVPRNFLVNLRKVCQKRGVPLIYNETASSGFVYDSSHYFISSDKDLTPDVGFAFLGGQAGIVFCRKGIWVPDPLMMISTWDGDEFSFANYHRSMQNILQNPKQYESLVNKFEKALKSFLSNHSVESMSLHRGRGRFKGTLPEALQSYFECWDGYYLVDPSCCQMKRFLAEYGE